jgi:hypothetical protein
MADAIVLDPRAHNLSGRTFGMLTAIRPIGSTRGYVIWQCRCECGGTVDVPSKNLTALRTTHCGCRTQQRGTAPNEYRTWCDMKNRCSNPNNKRYAIYGARGITVCSRWRESFAAFIEDMGPCPVGMSLDRINNDGPYSAENCRWTTMLVQGRNTRHNRKITHNGETKCLVEWAEATGINADAIYGRLKLGWSIERALTEPVQLGRRKKQRRPDDR